MPSGNSLRVARSMPARRCSCIRPSVRLVNKRREVDAVDQIQGIEDVAPGLRHLLPFVIADERMDVDVAERHVADELQAHHDHPCDPEEDDVEARDEHARRVERRELGRALRPAERRERPQRGREPRVEHVLVLAQRDIGAQAVLGAHFGLVARDVDVARRRRTMPGMRWPHQSCREMHQSWMLCIHSK